MGSSKRNKRAASAALLCVGVAVLWWFSPSMETLIGLLERTRSTGPRGYVVYAGLYLVATLLMGPASILQGSAGFLFGPLWGWVVAALLSNGFGAVNFLLARTVLRKWVASRIAHDTRFASIDAAIGDGGASLVALLRVSPVSPYNVVCYTLGLTQVSLGRYALGTFVGSLVPVTLYTYLGSTVGSVAELVDGNASSASWVQWVGLVATLIATAGVTRYAQIALKRALKPEAGNGSAPPSQDDPLTPTRSNQ
jgi:uncharacterized membrane protein YdjX (TVP38/TMEM64 family)